MKIFEAFGKVIDIKDEPGLVCFPRVCCVEEHDVSTAVRSIALRGSSVPDKTGSPMHVSAIMNYRVIDAITYKYSVENPTSYIENQCLEVLRRVAGLFPYRSTTEPCLISDSKFIGVCMRELVQEKVYLCGIEVISMEIMEVAYSPEVATSLLQVQQA